MNLYQKIQNFIKNNILVIIVSFLLFVIILWIDFLFWKWTFFLLDKVIFPIDQLNINFFLPLWDNLENILIYLLWYSFYTKLYFIFILSITTFLWIKIWNYINKDNKLLQITWILFFLFNPFMYERTLSQPWVYLWILFFWLWFMFLLEKRYITSIFIMWISFSILPHSIFFIFISFLIYWILYYKDIIKNYKKIFIWLWIFILLNIWFIFNTFLWNSRANLVNTFNNNDIEAFSNNSLIWNTTFTNILWYWFWLEKWENNYKYMLLPNDINNKWFISWIILLLISIFWLYKVKDNKERILFFTILFLSLILWWWTEWILWNFYNYLYEIPFYSWLREPQKWIWIYLFIFWIWIVNFFNFIYEKKIKIWIANIKYEQYFFVVLFFILLQLWSPNIIFWFRWQLFLKEYPIEIQESKNFLINNWYEGKEWLLLPWHNYMSCKWSWRLAMNPFQWYFLPIKLSKADNVEMNWLEDNYEDLLEKEIKQFLTNKNIEILYKNNIEYIIYMKECWNTEQKDIIENIWNKVFENDLVIIKTLNE